MREPRLIAPRPYVFCYVTPNLGARAEPNRRLGKGSQWEILVKKNQMGGFGMMNVSIHE
ncbi:hypothetical protein [Peribacillus glennii]|uniref:hypothetical protein n=1 Tax=Peribacillus glennii TaxID=2303991 RepID=UPI0013145EAA|nr:hypothetical protein [Peribacillus glennii]